MIYGKNKVYVFGILIIAMFFVSLLCFTPKAQAATVNFSGYAWSPNIGWINFNNVKYDISNGNVSGYAWSPNIGWIQFGGLSGFPTDFGTTNANANISLTTGKMTGWARAWSLKNPSDTETDPITGLSIEWADGWISFDGTSYTTSFDIMSTGNTNANSYAWGSNVIGWINFSNVKIPQGPTCKVIASPSNMFTQTNTSTISWPGNYLSSCTGLAGGSTGWAGSKTVGDTFGPVGIFSSPVFYNYAMSCKGTNGATKTCTPATLTVINHPAVAGQCSNTHYGCAPGTLIPGSSVEGTSSWVWKCHGLYGGVDSGTCSQPKVIGGCSSIAPTYPACCSILRPTLPADISTCTKQPHYQEN